ncbi:hypothetical protein [[Phormidium] sp. ETS-05]|nr:hypothetical protein [[Phormidium] sp. ETS-05]
MITIIIIVLPQDPIRVLANHSRRLEGRGFLVMHPIAPTNDS